MTESMEPQQPVVEPPAEDQELQKNLEAVKNGSGWFFVIAALSVINSVLNFFGARWAFIFGLGITQVADGIGMAAAEEGLQGPGLWIVRLVALGFTVAAAAVFSLFGWLARKGYGWAFLVGIVLYALDAALLLALMEWRGIVFHIIALYFMVAGYSALRRVHALQPAGSIEQPDETPGA
jgi:hypothetical protein